MPIIKTRLLALVLVLATLDVHALSLGRLRGAALVGQGLDVSVLVQPDPDDNLSNLCLEVDLFHADARQDPGRVQVSFEPAAAGQPVNVRIQSSVVIDEPVVTLYVRAGCAQKTSRRYVLLADIASEPIAPSPPRPAQLPLITPSPAPVSAASTENAGPAVSAPNADRTATGTRPAGAGPASKRPATAKPAKVPGVVKAAKPAKPAKATPAAAAPLPTPAEKLQAGRAGGQSRLKLDPLEVLSERVATLESSTASAPGDQAARAAVEAQRLQTLEASVRSLVAVAAQNEASLLDLRAKLQQAQTERYLNPLVIGLLLLLLVCAAVIAFLLLRRKGSASSAQGNWWSADEPRPTENSTPTVGAGLPQPSDFSPVSAPAPMSGPGSLPAPVEPQGGRGPRSRPTPITQVDVSLVEMSESTFDRLMQSGATHSAVRKPRDLPVAGVSVGAPVRRLVNAEELFDIRQQAEFFVSLGQTDQAVRILENRISENGEASPLAYLDLLKIFHSLGLKADFRQIREDFNLLFNAKVPDFAAFGEEGRELWDYPHVLADIEVAWKSPQAADMVEALLFRDQWDEAREVFDLAAFRDLLLLHTIVQAAAALPDELVVAAAPSMLRPYPARKGAAGGLSVPGELSPELVLPTLDGAGEVDIDLSEPVAGGAPSVDALELPSDLANLINFELSGEPRKGGPAPDK